MARRAAIDASAMNQAVWVTRGVKGVTAVRNDLRLK